MHRGYLVAVLLSTCQALAAADPLCAMDDNAASAASVDTPARERPAQADPVIERIRSNLADSRLRGDVDAADLAALQAFYGSSSVAPLWITDMGLSARGQLAVFEIEKANDWGLDAAAFELPPAGDLPAGPDEEAIAEIKLDLAILKYARFARGGRLNPHELSGLFDHAPSLRDPKLVLMEIAAARAPDAYLRSLHPRHEQFVRLREALLRMRGGEAAGKPRRHQTADHQHGALAMDARRLRSSLCLGQHPRVHALCDQERENHLCGQNPSRHEQ